MKRTVTYLFALILASLGGTQLLAQTKLLRFPDIHGDRVVFSYAGDLWLVDSGGGTATRLTADEGLELFPKFSPDGEWIAFTGQYDGDEQVYVMPARGGVPKQLTFYPARGPLPPRWGYDHQVYGWSPDGEEILFRSLRDSWTLGNPRLFKVSRTGGLPVALPMPVGGSGDFSPDGQSLAYTPLFRDFRTWKRYQGGWAQDLYIFDLQSRSARRVTDHPRSDRDPMWIGDRIYFSSDRTGTLNLFSYDLDSGEIEQLTEETNWDVRWPSSGPDGQIVYELNGELTILDTSSSDSRKISIFVPDDGLHKRPERIKAADNIEDFELSPKGKRALFVARGDIFTVPVEKGPVRNLTQTSAAHDKWARWAPDGSRIAFVSDQDGEEEIYLIEPGGFAEPEQITDGGIGLKYAPVWSPDSKKIAYSDHRGKLFVLDVETREVQEIADDERGQIRDYSWSPGGDYLAFSQSDSFYNFRSIYIWSASENQSHRVTSADFHEFSPTWQAEGDYLFFLSDREFAPQIGSFEWNYVVDRETEVFAVALRKDVAHLFPPESDEAEVATPDEDEKPEGDGEESEADSDGEDAEGELEGEPQDDTSKPVIDFEGVESRVIRVPISADNLGALTAKKGHLIFVSGSAFYYGRSPKQPPSLEIFSLKERKTTTLAEEISGYALSPDGSQVLVRTGTQFSLLSATPNGGKEKKSVSTGGLELTRNPEQEWAQIFGEVWRRFRDFFYVENMHGYDWEALRRKYEPLLEHVAHRSDLNYLMGEMVSELNVSHAYISGGDYATPDRPSVALPGIRFEVESGAGRYQVAEILEGQNEEPRYRSPLQELGIQVQQGDYILAIDGRPLSTTDNPYEFLRYKADRPVRMTVSATPDETESRQITFEPVSSEENLNYFSWISENRRKVSELSQGRIGYLHVPDMGSNGIREFIKWFYPQIGKEGLVIDVRSNGGGNVSQMLIERLRRELLALGFSRHNEHPTTYPQTVFPGHLVCLLDENSASDGDIFPAMFREAGLGPLIGQRSWGGVIGITNRGTLIDGGTVNVPEFGFASADGEWVIEGYGVEPDIEVENRPQDVIEGRDPQLERGVQELLDRIEADPPDLPARPPAPDRSP